ncbi:hypothetical protein QUC31_013136 [Theobroma cacao]|uniref:LOB domain-containing protein 27 n=1 Tax=Theobroma cacao TaxID=3641 RepID=A0AB32V1U3_THECC|nr:PREDICTED: LOB domain-containing protein 27 [Theobroma cacao]WRX26324.1 Lateral organ boundary protein [Theobroma cacao]
MTLKGGTASACAACKYQRRKCTPECPLAPYFPAEQARVFQNAHKLFGVSNILKILKNLNPAQQAEAMRSIKYQSNVRDQFPVYGCLGVIRQLQYQIQLVEEELHAVHAQLEMYRQHHQISSIADDVPSQLELGMAPPSNALPLFNQVPQQHYNSLAALPVSMQHSYSNSSNVDYSSSYMDSKENVANSLWVQHPFATNNNTDNGSTMAIQSQLVAPQTVAVQQQVVQDYDEIHPFFDAIDDRQSYIDSKEPYESSSEESLKDTTQSVEHVAENELKSAAACFSLTSVN